MNRQFEDLADQAAIHSPLTLKQARSAVFFCLTVQCARRKIRTAMAAAWKQQRKTRDIRRAAFSRIYNP